ncbi:peamaclein-like [Silene latifolia]|uniref:peamaclein-like n=1 Tax=Silene latifolia TaxID=37657 RepID=UPI003D770D15
MEGRGCFLIIIFVFFCFSQVLSDFDFEADEDLPYNLHQVTVRGGNRRLMQSIDCQGLCGVRCGRHSRPNMCLRACGTCCMRCKCVPPGTYGNREACGVCYTDMTTHGNKTKCP